MKTAPHLYVVILAGGSGTRFWPLSRELYPKQLLRIVGDKTLIQQTAERALGCVPTTNILIVTSAAQANVIRTECMQWAPSLNDALLIEPEGKNTAPAIALAATHLARSDPQAIMLVLPADHAIGNAKKFQQAVKRGVRLAQDGHLVTFGVTPTHPETGYGYIEPDRRLKLASQGRQYGFRIRRFIEKPDAATAQKLVKAKRFYWNSGMFVWQASSILTELALHQPRLSKAMAHVDTTALTSLSKAYRKLKPLSIDNAVMEHTSNAAVVPAEFAWSDVGSWTAFADIAPRTPSGNIISGNVMDFGSTHSILHGDRRLIATIGLSDTIVVDTPDATLICPTSRAQEVKKVVEALKTRNAPERVQHRTVSTTWGSTTVVDQGPGFQVTRRTIRSGETVDVPGHRRNAERLVVVQGHARVTVNRHTDTLAAGQSVDIPKGLDHQIENRGKHNVEIITIQTSPTTKSK